MHPHHSRVPNRPRLFSPTIWWIHFIAASKMKFEALKHLVLVFIKCLSLIVGFAVTVAIWPREVVSCHDFILCTVATIWAMSLVRIYPGRASYILQLHLYGDCKFAILVPFNSIYSPKPSLKNTLILFFHSVQW